MANQQVGIVYFIYPTESRQGKNGKEFYTRKLVLDCGMYDQYTGEKRDNFVQIEFSGEKCNLLDQFAAGQRVVVSFALRGTIYEKDGEGRCFTKIEGWKVELAENQPQQVQQPAQPAYQPQQPQQPQQPTYQNAGMPMNGKSELPF